MVSMPYALPLRRRGIAASPIALGCMGLGGGPNDGPVDAGHVREAHAAIDAALEAGINLFDHADIYGRGKAETAFGRALKERPGLREHMLLQTKCGIRFAEGDRVPGRYDFSREHILRSVDGSLERLGVDCVDILLLHRPDPLVDPAEVADAFRRLSDSGKVRHFGVSNMGQGQIRLLQVYCDVPLIVDQLELSLAHTGWLDAGVHVNQEASSGDTFPEGTIEFLRLEQIQVQAWAPVAKGYLVGRPLDPAHQALAPVASLVQTMANERGVTPDAVAIAWLLAHPAAIQPVIGTRNPDRIRAAAQAVHLELSREDWYALYVRSRGTPLP
jgi:predicted oxidoreductase